MAREEHIIHLHRQLALRMQGCELTLEEERHRLNFMKTQKQQRKTHLNGSVESHGEVEHKVTNVASEVEHKVIKTETNNTVSTEVLIDLRVVTAAPHNKVQPTDQDAEVAKNNLMNHFDLDTDLKEILQLRRLGGSLEGHNAVASDIA